MNSEPAAMAALVVVGAVLLTALVGGMIFLFVALFGATLGYVLAYLVVAVSLFLVCWWVFRI